VRSVVADGARPPRAPASSRAGRDRRARSPPTPPARTPALSAAAGPEWKAAVDGGPHRLSEIHHGARLGVALRQRGDAESALGELARGEHVDPQRELAAAPAVAPGVPVAMNE